MASVLLPNFRIFYNFLNENVFPIIQSIASWIGDRLTPAFDGLTRFLQDATSWFRSLADSMNSLSLPDWLTPGSPFPFTNALVGMNEELQKSAVNILPEFSAQLAINGSMPVPNTANNNSGIITAINNLGNNKLDERKLARLIADAFTKIGG